MLDTRTLIYVLIVIFGAIGGCYAFVIKCAGKRVHKDVCESEKHRLEDCIEGAIKRSNEKHKELKVDIKELKDDMKSDFAEVKDLIRKNSHS